MRILYIMSSTSMSGGSTLSFFSMVDGILSSGHEIAVVFPNEEGAALEARKMGLKMLSVPYSFCWFPPVPKTLKGKIGYIPKVMLTLIKNYRARKVVNKFAEEFHPDIIHDNTSVTDLGHYAALKLGIPHVIHVREFGWKDFKMRLPFIKSRLKYTDAHIIAITKELAAFRGKSMDRSHVNCVYNGVVSEKDFGYDSEKDPFFLYVGRIQEVKGVADLIEAYISYIKHCQASNQLPLRLKLAGGFNDPKFYDHVSHRLKEADVDNYVDWLGEISDVKNYMAKAVATVIPSKYEAFGRVMPEAMAAGSLCIARPTGGSLEQLEVGKSITGRDIALTFENVNELVSQMKNVDIAYRTGNGFDKDGKYYDIIMDSQKVVAELYTNESVGKNILKIYESILKENSQ